ncbi:MAG TPA: hypothetical protein VEX86_13760 [Longimicrobium sp.]|nr:hypothetical protein [Longimicrobium sp.]
MKKLNLDLDDLRVDQFAVESMSSATRRGSVMGQGQQGTEAEALITEWGCHYTDGNDVSCYLGSCYSGNPCRKCPYGG